MPTSRSAADSPSGHSAAAMLLRALEGVARLHADRQADPAFAAALKRLGDWQARRLAQTYADLAAQPRFAAAIEFFETDLYGGKNFAQRDHDLARVVPVMTRMLPEGVIATVATAVELDRLTQELDRQLLARLPRATGTFTVAEYASAYRRMGNRAGRERQIRLIGDIGTALDRFVGNSLVYGALVMMRHPARLAGFSALHNFLERGFAAFRAMGGADEFLATIDRRERKLMAAIFAGEPAPFPDPGEG